MLLTEEDVAMNVDSAVTRFQGFEREAERFEQQPSRDAAFCLRNPSEQSPLTATEATKWPRVFPGL
jgi:hypothetical protein